MNRSTTATAARAIGFPASVVLWTAAAALPALAAPSHPGPQEPQATAAPSGDASTRAPALPQQSAADSGNTGIDWMRWSYGARGIVAFSRQDSLDRGLGASGVAVLPLTTDLELEGEIGFVTTSTEADGLPTGRLTVFPLRGTLRVQLWRFGGAEPYAGAGAGIYLNRFSLDPAVEQQLAQVGFGASASVDPALGFHAAGGVEWQRDRVHFGVDVKYVFADANAASTVVDLVTEQVIRETSTLDLDGLWIAAGARFDFDF